MPRAPAFALWVTIAALSGPALAPAGASAQAAPDPLPGVDLGGLTPAQVEVVRRVARDAFCYCGCPHALSGCLREHPGCKHARRMAALAVRLARTGISADEVSRALDDHYAGFERSRRAKLTVEQFGPPLGAPAAPATLVEFSDFTCPFCQLLRPELERFVLENAPRVKLFFKPFPIASHPRAREAAIAGEWARDHGLFWKMHDRLFGQPSQLSDDDLAAAADALGGDAPDLRLALEQGRNAPRVSASQQEARAAGVSGTPTLYLNGRKLALTGAPGDVAETLRLALEEEEEWTRHGGWERD